MEKKRVCTYICIIIIFILFLNMKNIKKVSTDEEEIRKGILGMFTTEEMDQLFDNEFVVQEHNIIEQYRFSQLQVCSEMVTQGILCRKEDIIIVDRENNQLLILDYEGQLLRTVGKTGNGPLEFLNPQGITEQEGKIYILDAGNKRIQVLYPDFDYQTEIHFPEDITGKIEKTNSIAVDGDGNIFVSCADIGYTKILCYNSMDKIFSEIGQNFFGTVAEREGKVYAVNIGFAITENGKRVTGWRSGPNYLYSLTTEGMEMIAELPYGTIVLAFQVVEEGILCISNGYHTVDLYGFDGSYKCTYGYQEEIQAIGCIDIDQAGTIYISIPLAEKLYKIEKVLK